MCRGVWHLGLNMTKEQAYKEYLKLNKLKDVYAIKHSFFAAWDIQSNLFCNKVSDFLVEKDRLVRQLLVKEDNNISE